MSNRQRILEALHRHGPSTYGDLEAHTGLERNKLRWSCADLKAIKYIAQTEDAITQEVAWKITPLGQDAMAKGEPHNNVSDTPAGGGEITPAAAHSEPRVAGGQQRRTEPRRKGKAKTIEAAKRDDSPAEPASGEVDMNNVIDKLMQKCSEKDAEINTLEGRLKALTEEMDSLLLQALTPTAPARYGIALANELYDTPEEALAASGEYNDFEQLENCLVVACTAVGKVVIKATMEPYNA